MKKRLLLFARMAALPIAVLLAVPTIAAQSKDMKPVRVSLNDFNGFRPQHVTRAADKQGVTATLKYEQIANMTVPRIAHQVFPSGDGFVVVGGRTTGFQLTKTAELYRNGSWQSLSISNAHDGAFSVGLSDGRFMVGGGFSSNKGSGQSQATDIYDPQTRTFSAGPQLTTARAQSMAINTGGKIYVSGNWYAEDPTIDYYDGASFRAVGATDGRSNPYMLADRQGDLLIFSAYDVKGESFGYYTFDNGSVALLADKYTAATGKTEYIALPFSPQTTPMMLPDDTRPADYHFTQGGNNFYLILAKTPNGYRLYMLDVDELDLYVFNTFDIPTADAAGQTITWRGGVLINETRQEIYLIGASGPVSNQTLHVISLNYVTDEWTIASATGFKHNLLTASYTLLTDGRLVCTGGGIKDYTDAQRCAYIITPSVAGQGDEIPTPQYDGPRLVVWLKSGEKVVYELADAPVTTFSGSQLIIRTNKISAQYERSKVQRYTYEDVVYLGIDLQPGERRVQVNQEGDEVTFRGLPVGTTASIYSLDGLLVGQVKATDSQPLTISLQNRPDGVYIVKAGTETIKVMKK